MKYRYSFTALAIALAWTMFLMLKLFVPLMDWSIELPSVLGCFAVCACVVLPPILMLWVGVWLDERRAQRLMQQKQEVV